MTRSVRSLGGATFALLAGTALIATLLAVTVLLYSSTPGTIENATSLTYGSADSVNLATISIARAILYSAYSKLLDDVDLALFYCSIPPTVPPLLLPVTYGDDITTLNETLYEKTSTLIESIPLLAVTPLSVDKTYSDISLKVCLFPGIAEAKVRSEVLSAQARYALIYTPSNVEANYDPFIAALYINITINYEIVAYTDLYGQVSLPSQPISSCQVYAEYRSADGSTETYRVYSEILENGPPQFKIKVTVPIERLIGDSAGASIIVKLLCSDSASTYLPLIIEVKKISNQ